MRRLPSVFLVAGIVLLSVGLLTMAGARAQQRQQDETLQHDASQVAAAFTSYFDRARSLDLLLAQSPALRTHAGEDFDTAQANHALGYLERLYPGAIGEACVIDAQGRELARVTEGVPAPVGDLSADEAHNPFFAPTFALRSGQVYQAAPYISPDTGHWVISNSTPIRRPGGRSLIVHFEVALDSFRQSLVTGADRHVAVVDGSSRRTVLADQSPLPAPSGKAAFAPSPYRDALGTVGSRPRTVTVDGRRAAVSRIRSEPGNANHWVVVEWSMHGASLVPPWVGGAAGVVGLGLILLFMVLLRGQHSALRMAARLDHLTGMANRRALEEALDDAVDDAGRHGERVGILMLDLDGFKQINDTLGHDKGDLVLQEIGRRLHANTFDCDTPARLGGDEFAVVVRQLVKSVDVGAVAHRLREALVRPILIDGVSRFVGVSIGAAVYADHGRSTAELLRAADAAMYRAKRGREGVRVYDVGTAAGAQGSWLAAELLLAIEKEEITMVYQPEHALDTGRIVGVEALARWVREGERDVPPAEFIPLAEQTGLIRQLTHLTLRTALDEVRAWYDAGCGVPVSVNLSARLVADRSLPDDIGAMLAERGLPGDALVLEVTETAMIENVDEACEVLTSLRALGVRIELDDFGSGYASVRALHQMPLDGVKVDGALVNDSTQGGQRLLAATFDMAKVLHLHVVAEGIEDEAGLAAVRRLGADIVQGYHLGRPMSPEAIRLTLGTARTATPARAAGGDAPAA
jgi:diguanylate cyclase (GGDEF)-like protein